MTTASRPLSLDQPPRHFFSTLLVTLVAFAGVAVGVLVVLPARDDSGGPNVGSGEAATQIRELPPFTAVELAGSNHVTVEVGGDQRVVVHADDNLIDRVTTTVRAGSLVIADVGDFAARSPMSVDVSVPSLDDLTLSGSGTVAVEGVDAELFVVKVPGSGVLTVRGSAVRLDAALGGSGDVQLQDLVAREVEAGVSGSGRLQVHATGTLDASVSGSGAIFYFGEPRTVTQSITGSGAIIRQ